MSKKKKKNTPRFGKHKELSNIKEKKSHPHSLATTEWAPISKHNS